MILVHCAWCGKELDQPGAVILGPSGETSPLVIKLHACRSCWGNLMPSKLYVSGHTEPVTVAERAG